MQYHTNNGTKSSIVGSMAKVNELRLIRQSLGLTQTDMGALLGVKQPGYARWEDEPEKPAAQAALEKARGIFRDRLGAEWKIPPPASILGHDGSSGEIERVEQPDPYYLATPGFPEKQIVRATELVIELMGAGKLSPYKMGGYIASVAEMLVLGETEEAIRKLQGPPIRALAYSEVRRPPHLDPS